MRKGCQVYYGYAFKARPEKSLPRVSFSAVRRMKKKQRVKKRNMDFPFISTLRLFPLSHTYETALPNFVSKKKHESSQLTAHNSSWLPLTHFRDKLRFVVACWGGDEMFTPREGLLVDRFTRRLSDLVTPLNNIRAKLDIMTRGEERRKNRARQINSSRRRGKKQAHGITG